MRKLVFVGAALFFTLPLARATLIFSDAFNYPDGSLTNAPATPWVSHSGSGQILVVSGRALLSQTNGEDDNAILQGGPYPATTNISLYASFTINVVTPPLYSGPTIGMNAYFAHFKDASAIGHRDKLFVLTNGIAPGFYRVGVGNMANAPNAIISTNLSFGVDYRLVTKYTPATAISTLWVEPAAESNPGAVAADSTSSLTITSFALRQSTSSGDGMGTLFLDNLLVGTTFGDVVPTNPPAIITQPTNQTVYEGTSPSLTVVASGSAPLAYQWQFYSTNLNGATSSTLTLPNVTTNQSGPYSVIITNIAGSTNSQIATLTVDPAPPPTPPSIVTQPQDQTVTQGSNATFSVTVSGTSPFSYQWLFYNTNLPAATNATLVLSNVTPVQAGAYSVAITNSTGSTNSQLANLVVIVPPSISVPPQDQTVNEGDNATFTVTASGTLPLTYQWRFNSTALAGATNTSLTLSAVAGNQSGPYSVVVSNSGGAVTSSPATLSVIVPNAAALSYVTYNMKGNGAGDWSTNAPQVQAIGRELSYLNPDIITFNEIPNGSTWQMTNFINVYLPGYYLATNSATDGFIRSGIASRYPILSSKSYLHSADLNPFGYTNANFTRDLFEAVISAPGFPQPLHVFVVHLKSGQDTDSSARRGAEASAISNFLVTVFLPTNTTFHPYFLSGDMNEDIDDPPSSNPQSIQRLVNPATGLRLTTPLNPFTGSNLTFSIQSTGGLSQRYDYIMPCGLFFSNITSSQVFRTDLLTNPPPPPPLLTNDDKTASDHLPVQMVFANPYTKPFRITSFNRSSQNVTVKWDSVAGQPYRLEASSNLAAWSSFSASLTATGATSIFATNSTAQTRFFRIYRLP